MDKLALEKMAVEVRKGIVSSVHSAKAGHPGGSLSAADIFTYLYFEEMNIDPKNPKKEDRDRFVLSKGHTAPGSSDFAPHRIVFAGTSRYEAYPGRGYVFGFFRAGAFRGVRNGACRQDEGRVLPRVRALRRR